MKSALVVMMIFGCDCEAVECRYLDTVSLNWASVEVCETDIEKQIVAARASYPLLEGRCMRRAEGGVPVFASRTGAPGLSTGQAAKDTPIVHGDHRIGEQVSGKRPIGLARSRSTGPANWFPPAGIVTGLVRNMKAGSLVRWLAASS